MITKELEVKVKKFISSILFVLLLSSCSFSPQHKGNETYWEDGEGNSIYFKWDLFGDAAVNYKNANSRVIKLRDYAYSDSQERMNIYVSQNSRNVCLLVYKTNNSKYKTGSVLHIFELSDNKDCIVKETVIDSIRLRDELLISDELVTYYDSDGNCYFHNFEDSVI